MSLIADLHLHSPYSRAVSKFMTIPEMSWQAQRRGIQLLATGDWTHPQWQAELTAELEEWSQGIFLRRQNPDGAKFLLSTEISCIYSQGGKVRRIHVLVMVPSFAAVAAITAELISRRCNLRADGRPIIGLSCIQLCDVVFAAAPEALVIPAHVWTPWFGVLGSHGGFDSLDEAFGEFADQIFAIETGLSSDPLMNWKVPELDRRAIVSFGDAHSPAKMGREATVFEFKPGLSPQDKFTYTDMYEALGERFRRQNSGSLMLASTIEFYPEEGKYHWDGHRACGVSQPPSVTRKKGLVCPVCGRPLTIGVESRVETLGDPTRLSLTAAKTSDEQHLVLAKHPTDPTRPGYINLVPLQEIIAAVYDKGFATKTVAKVYNEMLEKLGDEFSILMTINIEKIATVAGEQVATGILQVRQGQLDIEPGFDGEFGKVHLPSSSNANTAQPSLF